MRLLFLILSFIITALPARAADKVELPPEMHDFWALPDCENNMVAFAYSGHFAMQASGNLRRINRLERIEPAKNEGAYNVWSMTPGSPYIALKASGADTLLYGIAIYVEGYADMEPMADESNPIAMHFKRCGGVPANIAINEDQMAAFRALDRIDNICGANGGMADTECRKAIFDAADKNTDGAVDANELVGFWKGVSFLTSAGSSCAAPTPGGDPTASMTLTPAAAPPAPLPDDLDAGGFAEEAIRLADRDKNGAVSFEEASVFAPAEMAENYGARLRAAVPALGTFLPWLIAKRQ